MKHCSLQAAMILVTLLSSVSVVGRTVADRPNATKTPGASPAYCLAGHDIGRILLSVSNNGTIGAKWSFSGTRDCFTSVVVPSCEYPKGSGNTYLFGGSLWVGAVVGNDTLVSVGHDGWLTGAEWHPEFSPLGDMTYRSTLNPGSPNAIGAISEQDYIAAFYDTCQECIGVVPDPLDGRPHTPLNVQITQRSFSWSMPHAEDFVLIEYTLKNMGSNNLTEVYVGLYVDADVHDAGNLGTGWTDDLTGFRREFFASYMPVNCPAMDTLDVAYIIDNDGDFNASPPYNNPVPHVTGVRIIDAPPGASTISYNWWISNVSPTLDFGPQARATFRDLSTGGTGTPEGDRNKYHFLKNGEIDYDQVFTYAITSTDSVWSYPNQIVARDVSNGFDTRYLISTGPFDLTPGQEATVALAYVAGENIHVNPANYNDNLFNPYEPALYLEGLDFTDLGLNASWAGWVYDNPGVDTDSDGYAGEFRLCEGDTIWYKGDGVPDLRADIPPEAPVFWIEPRPSSLYARWNGRASEETLDAFSRQIDFEGYHAYLATDPSPASFALIGSYDIEDFHQLVWDTVISDYRVIEPVLTIEEARCRYAPSSCSDSVWHPEDYTRSNPYRLAGTDSIFYFVKVGPNSSRFGVETAFLKRFPAAPKPSTNWTADSVPANLTNVYLTDDSYFKYFEYEFTIDNLLPGKQYWVSITSFDHGSKVIGAAGSESPITGNSQPGIPDSGSGCCRGEVGNADGDPFDFVDIRDLVAMINTLFITFEPLICPEEGNTDGDPDGLIDVRDLVALINSLFITFDPLPACP